MRHRSDGFLLTLAVGLLLLSYLDTLYQYAQAAVARVDLSTAARSSPLPGDRAARVPPGLSFTTAAGCRPAADWRSARLDGRVRALLKAAARRDAIRVSCLHAGHSRYVRGTRRVSNHAVWRAADIDRVAGRPVGPGNPAAKRLALAIGRGRLGVQPSEVGSPWEFGRRPWFSDVDHRSHLHIGFGG